jgi:hypothetical protein
MDPPHTPTGEDVQRIVLKARRKKSFYFMLCVWLGLEVVVIILLALVISSTKYATLYLSSSCNTPLTKYYLDLYHGFGSKENTCTNAGNNICISWESDAPWKYFDSMSGADNTSSYTDARFTAPIHTAQNLLIVALIVTCIVLLLHLLVYCKKFGKLIFFLSPWLIIISFALSLSAG